MPDKQQRNRRQFTPEFKRDAVELVRTSARPIAQIATVSRYRCVDAQKAAGFAVAAACKAAGVTRSAYYAGPPASQPDQA
jgi:transposase-like protein